MSRTSLRFSERSLRRALQTLAVVATVVLAASSPTFAIEHVIHISVDGLRPSFMQSLINAGSAPNLKRFEDEGAWTNNARNDYSYTITLPNHTSMLTGRPVSQPAGMPNTVHHGWITNVNPPSTATLHNTGNLNVPYKASTFDVAHDAGFSTAHYASKSKFIIYEQSYNAVTGADHPNGRDKIDVFFAQENAAAAMQTQLLADMATNHFNYTFVHYADPDIAGHASGWGSTAYNNAVVTVDAYLGGLFNMIQNDPALAGRTAIVLSADHGGEGTDHSNAALAANYTIPFFVWGPGIAHGDLYSLNGGVRTDPLAARVDYNVAGQPVRNGDGGNLALSLLGLGPIPGSLINLAQNLRTAMIGDFNADGAINGTDLAALYSNFGMTQGATHAQGDADGDHDVDGADLLVWQQKFSSPMVATATPEPGATALAVFAWAALATLRRAPQRRPTLAA